MRLSAQVIRLSRYLCICLLLLLTPVALAEPVWLLQRNERDVLLWSRERANSPLKEVRAVTRLKTRLSAVIALLQDYNAHPDWVPYSKQARATGSHSATEQSIEVTLDAPWPLTDRVVIVDYRWWQTERRKVLHVAVDGRPKETLDPNLPPDFCTMQAHWTLYPNPDGTVIIEYQGHVNKCNQVPSWITNRVQLNAIWKMLVNMRQMLQLPTYQLQQVEGIVEPRLYIKPLQQQAAG